MYTRYMQYNGFFEPEYEQPFTYAHQRQEFEEKQVEAEQLRQEQIKADGEKPQSVKSGGSQRERKPEREHKPERERKHRSERERKAVSPSRRDYSSGRRKTSVPLLGRLGAKGGLLDGLDLDTADILLILLLFYLYQESNDSEFLILLALLFLG